MELTHQPLIYLYNNILDKNIQNCINSFALSVVEKRDFKKHRNHAGRIKDAHQWARISIFHDSFI